ncbi:outer membrane protein TolC precursor [bacterium BMS3Bbin03]|nr:outer membrane protein TolC precursor [bacterium BMS3Bbin03]
MKILRVVILFVLICGGFSIQIVFAQHTPLRLHDLIVLALKQNADVKIQSGEKNIAKLQKRQAFSQLLPQADVEAGYFKNSVHNDVPDFVTANGIIEKTAWLSFSQSVFNPGKVADWLNNRLNQKKQESLFNQTRQNVLMQVIGAYFTALQNKDEIKIFKENLNAFNLLYKQSRLLYENGVVPQLDVKKSRVEYLLQENALARARKNYRDALDYVKELVGLQIGDSISLAHFSGKSTHLDSLPVYLTTAFTNRSELKVLGIQARQFRNQKRSVFLQHLPSASFAAYYGWDTNASLRAGNRGWQIYAGIQMPLWHWGNLHQERQIVEIRIQQTEILRKRLKKQIARQVINSFKECRIQLQQMRAMHESEKDAGDAVRMAELGYQTGTVTNLDVINTQKLFTETRVRYLRSLYSFYVAKAHLYRNIGKLKEDVSWLR